MKYILILLIIIGVAGGLWYLNHPMMNDHANNMLPVTNEQGKILYYTCSMHPSVKVTPEDYNKGNTTCPICAMPLVPVKKTVGSAGAGDGQSLSKETLIALSQTEASLANVHTTEVMFRPLFKEIRTVGQVAYDPKLVVAQEELVAALKARIKLNDAPADVLERSERLLFSARRKLRLLGMGEDQVKELELSQKVDTSLLLPEDSVWIYADVYEVDSRFVNPGQQVMVHAESAPGKMLHGVIKAIDPIIKGMTRTLRARILVKNAGAENLLPNMYVDVFINTPLGKKLAVPKEAVLDTGQRTIVYVAKDGSSGENKYSQQEVKIGSEAVIYINGLRKRVYPVSKGLKPMQRVVSKANFLIDSQSQIGAAASAFGGALGDKEEAMPMPMGHQH